MNFIQRVGAAFMAAAKAFSQEYFATDQSYAATFESLEARLLRYAVNQAYYDNTVFSEFQTFAAGIKRARPALYKYIKNVYNPSYRLAQVYRRNIWGGLLDAEAGDKGAIPIKVGKGVNETQLRAAIAHQLVVSNWAANKTVLPFKGSIAGDCAIIVRDLPEKELARIEILDAAIISDAEFDSGIVKSYELSEMRVDNEGKDALYIETCERGEGEEVIFSTFRGDTKTPYAWDSNVGPDGEPRSRWVEQYGFIPLVVIQHDNIGLNWGASEFHVLQTKINSVEDLASALHDHIRRAQSGMGLLAGVVAPSEENREITGRTPTTDKLDPGREEQNLIYAENTPEAHFDSMVFPLDIASVSTEIQNCISDWEKDFPELRTDIWQSDARVEGVKAAREQVEDKIIERRTAYDAGLVRALQMAIAIGGMRKYKGFEGFDLRSFKAGKMNFSISPRPVFKDDPTDKFKDVPTQITALSKLRTDNPGLLPNEFYVERIAALYEMDEKVKELMDKAKNESELEMAQTTGAAGNVPPLAVDSLRDSSPFAKPDQANAQDS